MIKNVAMIRHGIAEAIENCSYYGNVNASRIVGRGVVELRLLDVCLTLLLVMACYEGRCKLLLVVKVIIDVVRSFT